MRKTLAALAAAAACMSAEAVTSYDLSIDGRQVQFLTDEWRCSGDEFPFGSCPESSVVTPWHADVRLTTPDGDGTFDWLALTLSVDGKPHSTGAVQYVTVAGGQVTSWRGRLLVDASPLFDVVLHFAPEVFWENLPTYFLFEENGTLRMNLADLDESGNLTRFQFKEGIAVSAIPEPETWALLFAGLGVIGTLQRRRSSASVTAT